MTQSVHFNILFEDDLLLVTFFLFYADSDHTLRNKGTKAVTGAVPFQKVHVCT